VHKWGGALGPSQSKFLRVILENKGLSLFSLFSSEFKYLSQNFEDLSLVVLKLEIKCLFLDFANIGKIYCGEK